MMPKQFDDKIRLIQDDIIYLSVDAIVYAANSSTGIDGFAKAETACIALIGYL